MIDHNELAIKASTDEQAFTELYELYIDLIFAFVMKRIGHKETAEDLVSEIFRKVFLNLNSYNPEKASFRTWIFRITNNTLIDYYRVTRNPNKPENVDIDEVIGLSSTEVSPHDIVLSHEQQEYMRGCLGQLPPKQQSILQLKFYDGYSNQEIAEIMKISTSNVGVLIHRALKKTKTIIEQSS